MKTNTTQLVSDVTRCCIELAELRRAVEAGPPETAELLKMKDRVREHDLVVKHLHEEMAARQLADGALEMAAIDRYYQLTDEQQDKLKQYPGKEPWYEFEHIWRCKAQDRIDEEE